MRFINISAMQWLFLVPPLALLLVWSFRAGLRSLRRFAGDVLARQLASSFSPGRAVARIVIILAAAVLIIFALARPAWNRREIQVKRSGRDIVFLLDISRSMLAQDVRPNRLERAKIAIRDVVSSLHGDRVALVAFAGTPIVRCPLTTDYGFFRLTLDDVNVSSVDRGGSMIGDAIRLALSEGFDSEPAKFRDIILLTDGEDQGSFPVEAASQAGELGVRIITVGLGDPDKGSIIPVTDENGKQVPLKYKGETVRSRMHGDLLHKMALASRDGRYLPVGTGNVNLDEVYAEFIRQDEQREIEDKTEVKYDEQFQLFLAAALVLLLLEMALSQRRRGGDIT